MSDNRIAEDIVSTFIGKGVKVLAIDFDRTIVKVHTSGFWKQETSKLVEQVRPCFKSLMDAAVAQWHELLTCVVTYSVQPELIKDVLAQALNDAGDVRKVMIRANTKDWVEGGGSAGPPTTLGKQNHIAWICTTLYEKRRRIVEPHEILLLDDDVDNINIAKDFGHNAMLIDDDITLEKLQTFAKDMRIEKRSAVK